MLQLRETRIVNSQPNDVLTGHIIPEEGLALAYVKEGADTKVQLSTGAQDEVFAGVSFSRNCPPAVLPVVLEGVVNADAQFVLPRNPVAGQLLVQLSGQSNPQTIVVGAPGGLDEVQVIPLALQFLASTGTPPAGGAEGLAVRVQFLYSPTVQEARSIIGDAPIGGLPSSAQGSIGVLKNAIIGTNSYDASVDWSNALFVKTLAAGGDASKRGVFTVGTAGDHIPNVVVRVAPSAANPFLVLSLNVA